MNSLNSVPLIFALATLAIPLAYATESAQLETTFVGNSVIDLNWAEKDRLVHVYAQFTNFDPSDKYFTMNVIQSSTGQTVADSEIKVYTTADGLVNFGSMVTYFVNDQDICADELSGDEDQQTECTTVMTGDYEIQITSRDGSVVESESFTIADTRV